MNRREFVGAAAATGVLLMKPGTAFGYAANSAVQWGLLGCGNRGTSVATSFAENTSARIVALGDLFPDKLEKGKAHFDEVNGKLGVAKIDPKLMFRGHRAFEELAASKSVDAVQISTPPWFHVQHLEGVVNAGKHVYCEKPLGVDVAQAKHALEIGKKAQGKLSFDVGFQVRSAPPLAEAIRRIHEGALGKIAQIAAHYNAPASSYPERSGVSADELRIRQWLWDKVLSGNILVEQNIHVIDLCNMILKGHPIKAVATGGRDVVKHAGDCWDHYEVIYTYPEDVRVSFSSTQFGTGGWFDVSESVFGSEGLAELPYSGPVRIVGEHAWEWKDETEPKKVRSGFAADGAFNDNLAFADREKDKAFVESITSGNFHNQAEDGVNSALSCMLGRMAGDLKREVTWDEQLAHGEQYSLKIDMSQFK